MPTLRKLVTLVMLPFLAVALFAVLMAVWLLGLITGENLLAE